ncbi:hypothetical protein WJX79_004756 [Trebouxia sp. C0005]
MTDILLLSEATLDNGRELTEGELEKSYLTFQQDIGIEDGPTRTGDTQKISRWPWSKDKLLLLNSTASTQTFIVETIPDYVTVKTDTGLNADAGGLGVKCAIEKQLGPFRTPQQASVLPGECKAFYLGPKSSYAYVRVSGRDDYNRVMPSSRQLVYTG